MQSFQAQKKSSRDGDSAYQRELKYNQGLRREDTILLWVWLPTLVLTAVDVLGGGAGLLTGFLHVVNPVTEGLITALVGVPSGGVCVSLAQRRKDISKQLENSNDKLDAMEQRNLSLGLGSSTSNEALKEKSDSIYIASLNKDQDKATPALLKQALPAVSQPQPQASTNYQDGYTGNS